MAELASSRFFAGRFTECEALYKAALAINLRTLPPGHDDTKKIKRNLRIAREAAQTPEQNGCAKRTRRFGLGHG